VHPLAQSVQYPLVCPTCDRHTAAAASYLLQHKSLQCRHCPQTLTMTEGQLNSLRRTLADLTAHMTRPQTEQTATEQSAQKAN